MRALFLCGLLAVAGSGWAQTSLKSKFAHRPPRIDGKIDFGEWEDAPRLRVESGYIAVMNDERRAYFLINVMDQTKEDLEDYLWLTFDVNRDRLISPETDVNYAVDPLKRTFGLQSYLGAGRLSELRPTSRSAMAGRFGSFAADGSTKWDGTRLSFRPHRVWETAIDLSEIKTKAGGLARMAMRAASPASGLVLETTRDFSRDFNQMVEVDFAASAVVTMGADANAVISLEANFLELTQAIQTPQNSVLLVAGKKTMARVFVKASNTTTKQPVWVSLYARRGGVELAGSPMVQFDHAPTSIDRKKVGDSVVFTLPDTWTSGSVEFQVRVEDAFDHVVNSTSLTRNFALRSVPTVWIVPINTGTATSPNVVSDAEIASQMSYMKATYPVADVDFVIQPWTVIGPLGGADVITKLREYHGQVLLGWILGFLFTGSSPFDLPLQVYGFTPSGGGISDPIWYFGSGHGYVARGYRGTSREGTMAHEINHNLDHSEVGTWGRHVPNGCGATGPDSAWPYVNDDIQEIGFDTRANPDDPAVVSVVPGTFPDFMSYCQSGTLPTKWISPYRYNHLFNFFAPSGGGMAAHEARLLQAGIQQNLVHLSGVLYPNGTGLLNPVVIQPGSPTEDPTGGAYAVEFRDSTGRALRRLAFEVNFEPLCEGEPVKEIAFDFRVTNPRGTASVVLLLKDKVLDEIVLSANSPTVTLSAPNGGENWRGTQTVSWKASDRDPRTVLSFNLQYSPDDGRTWVPVASQLKGSAYELDTTRLPGSAKARMRIIATDGFHTDQDDSDAAFAVATKRPEVFMLHPQAGDALLAGELTLLEGNAEDLEDGALPDSAMHWTLGAEVLGVGRRLEVQLPEGPHQLTLTATDSDGNQASRSVEIEVQALLANLEAALGRGGLVQLRWAATRRAVLQSAVNVTGPYTDTAAEATAVGDDLVVTVTPQAAHRFYRLLLVR